MKAEILYMLAIVGAGFAVNYGLRALPFLLFAGRDRELPSWVVRFGGLISPVIIGALIVYSFSGLGWKTAWPYLAGAATVALQLWKRNPLASIVAGTVIYMCLLNCGCVSVQTIDVSRDHTQLRIIDHNEVFVGNRRVNPADVPDLLRDSGVSTDTVIYFKADESLHNDLRYAGMNRDNAFCTRERGGQVYAELRNTDVFRMILLKGGYSKSVLVSDRRADSNKFSREERRGRDVRPTARSTRPPIRWK